MCVSQVTASGIGRVTLDGISGSVDADLKGLAKLYVHPSTGEHGAQSWL